MKYFIYILIIIASGLIIYNATHLDFGNLLDGNSKTALISIFASACVIVLLSILLVSKAIQKKKNNL
ncbi:MULTISPECIES: hypothetical protein [Aquimarina]|uniref:DUF3955 domain-containing protein n=1 Tax=Aquimarina algiphila TaxID=2047982 RepID=A0A554VK06_9FLAO|nr:MULTISPECIES: hypothetical protein [Aquimarina]TSE08286.1 hypothetical protein FOF46_12885 [Aquimarina algiphila]